MCGRDLEFLGGSYAMIIVAQSGVAMVGILMVFAFAATLGSMVSIGLSFGSARRHWFLAMLAIPSFVFGVALTVMWFTHEAAGSGFPIFTGANALLGSIGIGRWVLNQAR